jgi:hypothetical protein
MAKTRHFGASPKCRRFSLINDSQLPLNPLTERVGPDSQVTGNPTNQGLFHWCLTSAEMEKRSKFPQPGKRPGRDNLPKALLAEAFRRTLPFGGNANSESPVDGSFIFPFWRQYARPTPFTDNVSKQ